MAISWEGAVPPEFAAPDAGPSESPPAPKKPGAIVWEGASPPEWDAATSQPTPPEEPGVIAKALESTPARRNKRPRTPGVLEVSPKETPPVDPSPPDYTAVFTEEKKLPPAGGFTNLARGYTAEAARLTGDLATSLGAEGFGKEMNQTADWLNYVPAVSLESAKKDLEKGNYGKLASQIPEFIVHGIVTSAPHMMVLGAEASTPVGAAALSAYVTSLIERNARERAANDGREEYTAQDKLAVIPTTLASVGLDKYAFEGILKAGKKVGEVLPAGTKEVLKAAGKESGIATVREGSTEAQQSGLDYMGTHLGTKKGVDFGEMAQGMAFEGAMGAGVGMVLGGASAMYNESQNIRQEMDAIDGMNMLRRVEDVRARMEAGQLHVALAEDLGSISAENFVGPLTNTEYVRAMQEREAWALSELELLAQEREYTVKDAPVGSREQGPMWAGRRGLIGRDYESGQVGSWNAAAVGKVFGVANNVRLGKTNVHIPKEATYPERVAARLLADMAKVFAPDAEIYVMNEETYKKEKGHSYGSTWTILTDRGLRHYVGFDSNELNTLAGNTGLSLSATMMETIAHEFGHELLQQNYNKMPKDTRVALLNDYRRWLRSEDRGSRNFWQRRVNIGTGESDVAGLQTSLLSEPEGWNYWGNFQEFMAEQVARYVTREVVEGTGALGGPDSIFSVMAKGLQEKYRELTKAAPGLKHEYPAVNNWLDSLKYGNAAEAIRARTLETGSLMEGTSADSLTVEGKPKAEAVLIKAGTDAKVLPMTKAQLAQIGRETARYNEFIRQALTLPQLERENAHIPGVVDFVEGVRRWWATKNLWLDRAHQTLAYARELKIEQRKQELKGFEKYAFAVTLESGDKGRKLNNTELARIQADTGVSENGIKLFNKMQEDFRVSLNALEQSLLKDAQRKLLAKDPLAYDKRRKDIQKDFQQLRSQDYFPLSRFGTFAVTAKNDKGNVVYFSLWEREADADKDLAKMKAELGPDVHVFSRVLSDEARMLMDLPKSLVDHMKEIAVEEFIKLQPPGSLDPAAIADFHAQIEKEFAVAELDYSPGQRYLQRMKKRKYTPGFSEDALRSYASYMQSFANYIARLEHSHAMLSGIDQIGYNTYEKSQTDMAGAEVRKLDKLQHMFQDHYKYLMNPGNELAGLRALGAHWFLGFSPRAALVNLMQVPVATYPWLAARYGDGKALKALGRSMGDLRSAWRRGTDGAIEQDLAESIDEGFAGGFLNESLATELGVFTEGGNLKRLLPSWVPQSRQVNYGIKQYMHYSMWLFQNMEKVNRLSTFSAAYRLERDQILESMGLKDMEEAYDVGGQDLHEDVRKKAFLKARESVETTQGEYSRWARPRVMQGKKSALFLFKLYLQHMAYLTARDPGAWRFLLVQAALGGLIGLPFAQDAIDLLEWGLQQLPQFKNSKPEVEKMTREGLQELAEVLHVAPDLLMKGAGRYGFGALYPFDLSGSLGLGNIVPGTDILARSGAGQTNPYEAVGRTAEVVGGPMASVLINMWKGLASDQLDEWKQAELLMPKYMQNLSQAARWATRGEEAGYKGEEILSFDPNDPGHLAEILGKGLGGMQPRRLNEAREKKWAQQQAESFYIARRTYLMRQYWEAFEAKDREAEKDVWQAIVDYNKEIPFGEMGISGKDLERSIQNRVLGQVKAEGKLPDSKRFIRLYDDVAESFEGMEESSP